MGVVGGPASTFTPYAYVCGNPVNLTDPSGRIAPLVAGALYVGAAALIGGLVGGIVGGVGNLIHQLLQNGGNWNCLDLNAIAENAVKSAVGGAASVYGGARSLGAVADDVAGMFGKAANPLATFKKPGANAVDDGQVEVITSQANPSPAKPTLEWAPGKSDDPVRNVLHHWNRHKSEFPEIPNALQYAQRAQEFSSGTHTNFQIRSSSITRPPSTTPDVFYYNPSDNIIVMRNSFGVTTIYKPNPAFIKSVDMQQHSIGLMD